MKHVTSFEVSLFGVMITESSQQIRFAQRGGARG
jgi:hypothetical protein